eukprot:jgi/Chlat1/8462/Chrsp80S07869
MAALASSSAAAAYWRVSAELDVTCGKANAPRKEGALPRAADPSVAAFSGNSLKGRHCQALSTPPMRRDQRRHPAPPVSAALASEQENGDAAAVPFFCSDADGTDPDMPTKGFQSVAAAIDAVAEGRAVVLVEDDPEVGVRGDLLVAASKMTEATMAFMVRHTCGLVSVAVPGERLEALEIPPMMHDGVHERAAVSVSVDLKEGTSTGISAGDRTLTVRALAAGSSDGNDFRRPGHIFPLRAEDGGVLSRPGHTEAAVDLARLAGCASAGVLSTLVNDEDGELMQLAELQHFASQHGLLMVSVSDLIRYRRKRELLVQRTSKARLPTTFGVFQIYSYTSRLDGIEHVAMVCGDIGDGLNVLVRVHSECLTGDIFASLRCDCGPQLHMSLKRVADEGKGVVVYLRGHEGRGIGLGQKLHAYNLQDAGRDTVEANVDLGLPIDARDYGVGAQILRDLGVKTMRLMTNNPSKFKGLKGYGLAVVSRSPLITPVHDENRKYMETKRRKMGHMYDRDIVGDGLAVEEALAAAHIEHEEL